ncbi:MAG TPA: hypothetical protein VFR93_07425 [Candidatus Limnocylindrales bacterium]|nr:hypothetical protein [Candidatus Limnocylindrales bacterium]
MAEAFFWGAAASVSLVVGGVVAYVARVGQRSLGLVMAFGAGVLISAVAFELVEEAATTSAGSGGVGLGLFAGSVAFWLGDGFIDRLGGADRKRSSGEQSAGSGPAILLGIILDGIPESIVLGLTILQGGAVSVAFVVAVFLSNVPEAIGATTGLDRAGWPRGRVLGLWVAVTVVAGLAALLGYTVFAGASPRTIAFVLAFAGGAILTMLADTMMPEAFENAGPAVGLVTTLGFAFAYAITALE